MANIYLKKNGVWEPLVNTSTSQWDAKAIGEPFPLATNITGVSVPPTNDADFRYIKLSSSDAYNINNVLINETITGTAPVLSITAEINFPSSPLHGQRVELRNTSKVFSRAGENSGVIIGDTIRNITGTFAGGRDAVGSPSVYDNGSGAIFKQGNSEIAFTAGSSVRFNYGFDASRMVPTSNQNQPVHIEEPYFMRIF